VTAMAALRRDFLPLLEQGLLLSELLHDDGLTSAIRHAYARAVQAAVGTDETAEPSVAECPITASECLDQFDDGAEGGSDDGRAGDGGGSINSDSNELGRQAAWPTEQDPGISAAARLPSESGDVLHRTRDCGVQTHIALAPLSLTPLRPIFRGYSAEAPPAACSESPRTRLYASHFGVAWRVLFAPRRPTPPPAELCNPATARARPRMDSDTAAALPALGGRWDSGRDGGAPNRCQPGAAPYVGHDSDSTGPPVDSEVGRHDDAAFSRSRAASDAWRLVPKTSGPDSDRGGGCTNPSEQKFAANTGIVAVTRCIEIKPEGGSGSANVNMGFTTPPAIGIDGRDNLKHDMRLLVATRYLEGLACTCAIRIQQAVRARAARRAADSLRSGMVARVLEEAMRVVQRQARCWIARRTRRNYVAKSVTLGR
jgi:hypothetical protein